MDPFLGSGATCIAAKQLGRKYIGIELEENYHALAEARIAAYPQPIEWFGIREGRYKFLNLIYIYPPTYLYVLSKVWK